jgi:hypothetical protein
MEPLLVVIDLLLLLFCVRLWVSAEREFYFNPFLSGPMRLVDNTISFLRPVTLGLPAKFVCLLIMAFGLLFRALVFSRFGFPWRIALGTLFTYVPLQAGLAGSISFSILDFLFFIARLWSFYLLVQLITPVMRHDRASQAFHFSALPFSILKRPAQFFVLICVHFLLVLELSRYGKFIPPELPQTSYVPPTVDVPSQWVPMIRMAWLTAASLFDGFMAMRNTLLVLVFGGLIAMFIQNFALRQISQEAMHVTMGRFANRPVVVGMFDLTPIIFFVVINILHGIFSAFVLAVLLVINPV